MRQAVWRRLEVLWPAGSRIVELNCGTGVDAAWLGERGVAVVATDASEGMVDVARRRGVDARQMRAESTAQLAPLGPFDGALSNFGGLNCVADLGAVVDGLAACVRPGGTVVLCIMGPVVPWEWLWFLGHRRPRTAFRRFAPTSRGGAACRSGTRQSERCAARLPRRSTVGRVWALGAVIPPSYVESWARRHRPTVARLADVERRIERWPGVAHLADHYVLEVVRR